MIEKAKISIAMPGKASSPSKPPMKVHTTMKRGTKPNNRDGMDPEEQGLIQGVETSAVAVRRFFPSAEESEEYMQELKESERLDSEMDKMCAHIKR